MTILEIRYQKRWSSLRVRILLTEHRIVNSKSDHAAVFLRHNMEKTIEILKQEKEDLPKFIEHYKNNPQTPYTK